MFYVVAYMCVRVGSMCVFIFPPAPADSFGSSCNPVPKIVFAKGVSFMATMARELLLDCDAEDDGSLVADDVALSGGVDDAKYAKGDEPAFCDTDVQRIYSAFRQLAEVARSDEQPQSEQEAPYLRDSNNSSAAVPLTEVFQCLHFECHSIARKLVRFVVSMESATPTRLGAVDRALYCLGVLSLKEDVLLTIVDVGGPKVVLLILSLCLALGAEWLLVFHEYEKLRASPCSCLEPAALYNNLLNAVWLDVAQGLDANSIAVADENCHADQRLCSILMELIECDSLEEDAMAQHEEAMRHVISALTFACSASTECRLRILSHPVVHALAAHLLLWRHTLHGVALPFVAHVTRPTAGDVGGGRALELVNPLLPQVTKHCNDDGANCGVPCGPTPMGLVAQWLHDYNSDASLVRRCARLGVATFAVDALLHSNVEQEEEALAVPLTVLCELCRGGEDRAVADALGCASPAVVDPLCRLLLKARHLPVLQRRQCSLLLWLLCSCSDVESAFSNTNVEILRDCRADDDSVVRNNALHIIGTLSRFDAPP